MAKIRVHEIAKKLNLPSKNIITKLHELGVDVKNHMSNIDDSDSAKLLEVYKHRLDNQRSESAKSQSAVNPPTSESPDSSKSNEPQSDARKQSNEKGSEAQRRPNDRGGRRQRDGMSQRQGAPRRDRDQNDPGAPQSADAPPRSGSTQQGEPDNASGTQQSTPRRDDRFTGQRRDGQQSGTGQRRSGQQSGTGQRREGQYQQGYSGQRREGQYQQGSNGQRRDNRQQSGTGQRRDGQQQRGQGQQGPYQKNNGYRNRDGQPSLHGERQNIHRDGSQRQGNYQRRDGSQQGDGQQRDGVASGEAGQRRDGQQGNYQRRDGQQGQRREGQQGNYQRRDGQQGNYQRRDGQQGNYQRRDGQQGNYRRRDGQQGNYQRRDGQQGSYPRRDGQQGSPQRSDGQARTGGYTQQRSGQGNRPQTGTYQRREGGTGGYPKKDDQRPGSFPRRDTKPPYGKKDDKKPDQPSKDDRKQQFQKTEQARIDKSKGKNTGQRDNRGYYGKPSGQRRGSQQRKSRDAKKIIPIKVEPDIKLIKIPRFLTVKELAEKLHRSGADVVKALMKLGIMVTVNKEIDFDTAVSVCETFNVIVEEAIEVDPFEAAFSLDDDADNNKIERPPVVVVMGHVDHGKTSLLDAIRSAKVVAGEAGGITQHIGAYTVSINNKSITFLDTPGHEAFTAMRMRGAQVTDIAVLVVAADDGVMPQTIEAINHAKAAGVEIIVAVNKIDKQGANPDRVKQELTEHGILVEEWGGQTISVNVSAIQQTNIDQLLEMITIAAEMKELKANPDKPARGTVIEAQLDKGRGAVATVLVQNGTLKIGDTVVSGASHGRIRAMIDDKGRRIKSAGPSIPVEILGLSDVPHAGEAFYVATCEKQARMLSESVIAKGRVSMIKALPQKVSLDDLFDQIKAGNVKDLNIILKADVQGSVEALRTSLEKLSNEEVRVQVIHGAVGAVTESDVMLASTSSAIVIGFNVRPETNAKTMADTEKVDLRLYRIIYNVIEDITAAMKGMLDPVYQEKVVGHAEIRQLFKASSIGTIGGSYVTDGKIIRGTQVRIVRDSKVVYDGTLETLRRFKDDVREVNAGYECGLLFSKFNDIKEGDVAEAYVMEEIPR